jgi:hypothetical protein
MYTVLKLITNAFYLSGIVAREFQTVTGAQAQDGLDILNDILDDTAVENDMIPYYTQYFINLSPGVYSYFIPNLIKADTLVFFINGIRFSTTEMQRRQFFGVARADNVQSLPFSWHTERVANGAMLYLYFLPDQGYPVEIWGQFKLNQVQINQDLEASQAIAALGNVLYTPPGTIQPGDFTINGLSFAGTFTSANDLVNNPMTGINHFNNITDVTATLSNNFLILTSPKSINITSAGSGNSNITFSNFSTIGGNVPINPQQNTSGYNSQTFSLVQMERWYVNYLKYYCAKRFCIEWNYDVPQNVTSELSRLQMMISKRSQQLDMTAQKISTLQKDTTLNFGFINLSHGWSI